MLLPHFCCTFIKDPFQHFLQGKSSGDGLSQLCLEGSVFLLYLKDNFARQDILEAIFTFQLLDMSRHSLLAHRVSIKKFADSLVWGLVQVILIFSTSFL